jgi:hypothetical protein
MMVGLVWEGGRLPLIYDPSENVAKAVRHRFDGTSQYVLKKMLWDCLVYAEGYVIGGVTSLVVYTRG